MQKQHELNIAKLLPLVQLFRKSPFAELEVFVGCHDENGVFRAGTTQELFTQFKASIKNIVVDLPETWSDLVEDQVSATCYYPDGIRGRFLGVSPPVFIRKNLLRRVDIKCTNKTSSLRVTVKNEIPIEDYEYLSKPKSVRLHQRTSVTYKKCWRFDVSPVSQGDDKEQACANPETRELEVECLREALTHLTDLEIATQLLLRGGDLLGRYENNQLVHPILVT